MRKLLDTYYCGWHELKKWKIFAANIDLNHNPQHSQCLLSTMSDVPSSKLIYQFIPSLIIIQIGTTYSSNLNNHSSFFRLVGYIYQNKYILIYIVTILGIEENICIQQNCYNLIRHTKIIWFQISHELYILDS